MSVAYINVSQSATYLDLHLAYNNTTGTYTLPTSRLSYVTLIKFDRLGEKSRKSHHNTIMKSVKTLTPHRDGDDKPRPVVSKYNCSSLSSTKNTNVLAAWDAPARMHRRQRCNKSGGDKPKPKPKPRPVMDWT